MYGFSCDDTEIEQLKHLFGNLEVLKKENYKSYFHLKTEAEGVIKFMKTNNLTINDMICEECRNIYLDYGKTHEI